MNKLTAILDLFRKGESVSNKEAWKTGQITATALGGVLMAAAQVASAYGHPLPACMDADTVTAVAGAVIGAVNLVMTYVTSETVGLLPAKQ
jgi:hypothetical protein